MKEPDLHIYRMNYKELRKLSPDDFFKCWECQYCWHFASGITYCIRNLCKPTGSCHIRDRLDEVIFNETVD